jgi:transposase
MMKEPVRIELSLKDQEALLERIKTRTTTDKDAEILKGLIDFNSWLQYSLEQKNISIHKLQKIFGSGTEKRNKKDKNDKADKEKDKTNEESTLADDNVDSEASGPEPIDNGSTVNQGITPETKLKKYVPNHGRLGHEKYTNASLIHRECLYRPGDPCPEDSCTGKLKTAKPGYVIKIVGQSFAKANKYILETVRCNLCEKSFSAQLPEEICAEKYDPVFKAELCIHKYFLGVPNNRLESYQRLVGVPLPDSTQFDKIEDVANVGYAAFNHLESMGANGRLAHGDDTKVRIKSIIQANKGLDKKSRTGMFTTGLMCFNGDHKIYLFYSGRKHCGENMLSLLEKRDASLPKIQYMCDALNSNMPASLKAIFINCLAHWRRNFTDIEKLVRLNNLWVNLARRLDLNALHLHNLLNGFIQSHIIYFHCRIFVDFNIKGVFNIAYRLRI